MSDHTESRMNNIRVGRNNKILCYCEIHVLLMFLYYAQEYNLSLGLIYSFFKHNASKLVVCVYVCVYVFST